MSTIRLSVREARLVVERVLLVAGLPAGVVPAIRDFVIEAEVVGGEALSWLHARFADLEGADLAQLEVRRLGDAVLELDCKDQPAIVCAPTVLGMAVDAARRRGTAVVHVRRARDPQLLAALASAAERFGVRVAVLPTSHGPTDAVVGAAVPGDELCRTTFEADDARGVLVIAGQPAPGTADDPLAQLVGGKGAAEALRDGLSVDTELWWALYHKSNEALSFDTPMSRHHAGASALDEAGRIVGDIDDDHDLAPNGSDEPMPTLGDGGAA